MLIKAIIKNPLIKLLKLKILKLIIFYLFVFKNKIIRRDIIKIKEIITPVFIEKKIVAALIIEIIIGYPIKNGTGRKRIRSSSVNLNLDLKSLYFYILKSKPTNQYGRNYNHANHSKKAFKEKDFILKNGYLIF